MQNALLMRSSTGQSLDKRVKRAHWALVGGLSDLIHLTREGEMHTSKNSKNK